MMTCQNSGCPMCAKLTSVSRDSATFHSRNLEVEA
jgi:hypothetical protein